MTRLARRFLSLPVIPDEPVWGGSTSCNRKVKSETLRSRLVLRPPSAGVESGWNYVQTVDLVGLDGRSRLWAEFSCVLIDGNRQTKLAGQLRQWRVLVLIL